MSSAPRNTSSARPRPIKRGSRAIGPPPGTMPAPTSKCDRIAFSRLAKRMSQAKASSLPTPVARPRIDAIEHGRGPAQAHQHIREGLQTCWSRWQTGCLFNFREEIVVSHEKSVDRAVEDDNFEILVGFDRGDDLVQLRNRFRSEDI